MTPAEALAELRTNPETFLKYYPVKCFGSPAPTAGAANTTHYYLDKQDAEMLPLKPGDTEIKYGKAGHRGATRPGRVFGRPKNISSFNLKPMMSATAAATNALVVPMVNYDSDIYGCPNLNGDVTNMPHYVLDGTGDGLMVTGQLTGCCFSWIVSGNDLWCTHVQPKDGISSAELQVELRHGGRFAAAPTTPLHTFGRPEYPSGFASVIGVRSGGTWSLYAQVSSDGLRTIASAYRLYPGPKAAL